MKARHIAITLSLPCLCAGIPAAAHSLGLAATAGGDKPVAGRSTRNDARLPSLRAYPIVDGSSGGARRGFIGSLPITDGLSAGVGLLEVARDHRKERALRRIHPLKDVGAQTDRVAAVGLSLRF